MKKQLSVAAVALLIAGLSTAARANECGLNDQQLGRGWTCVPVAETVYRTIGSGNGAKCQPGTQTTWTATNPGGNVDPNHSVEGEPEWSKPADGAC